MVVLGGGLPWALDFDLNSKLTKVSVLTPTGFTSAGTNWLIAGSDSRGGLTKTEEDQLALGHDFSGGRSDTIMLLHMPSNGTRPTLVTTMVPFGGFGNTSAGSVVEWNVPEAKEFFHDLGTDTPLPKNLITGASVAGTT